MKKQLGLALAHLRLFAVSLLALCLPQGAGATDFASPTSYPVGTNPVVMVVGDFNGDGKLDVAVANAGSGNVSVLLGNGDGTFRAAVNSAVSLGSGPITLAVGDFNGDGKLDLIVVNPGDPGNNVPGVVNLLLGNGDGTFRAAVQITTGQFPFRVAVGDFNGDGKEDLIIGDEKDGSLSVLLGNGDGTFQPAKSISLASSGEVASLAVADFNGDKKLDVVAAVHNGPMVVLLGNGDGTFQSPIQVTSVNQDPLVIIGDFNSDQHLDLILRQSIGGCGVRGCRFSTSLAFYAGNGDGTFQPAAQIGRVPGANLAAGDFNADNKLDLFFGGCGFVQLLLNEGNGSSFIGLPTINLSGSCVGAGGLVAADFNGDGLPDLAMLGVSQDSVTILINNSPTSGADLALSLAGPPSSVPVGPNVSYAATVFNEGPQGSSGVILTESLPSGLQLVSAQPSQGTCSGTTTITCDLGMMVEPSVASVQFTVTPVAAGTFSDALQVAATTADLNPKNNSASFTITAVLPADLAITASASEATGKIGDKVTVRVNISNAGPADATNVILTDNLTVFIPTGSMAIDPSQISNLTSSVGNCTAGPGGTITCMLGTLASGAKATVSYVLTLSTSGTSDNSLSVRADQPDINPNNNTADVAINIPDFALSPADTVLTAGRGQLVTDVLSIGMAGGFSGAIALSCNVTGPAPLPTCSLSPNSIPAGANSPTSTLTINVPASAALPPPEAVWRVHPLYPIAVLLIVLALALGAERSRRARRAWALSGCVATLALLISACGSGSSSTVPPPQSFNITVTAQSGAIMRTTQIILTVQ
jgi:uncharacterized repeat protein (TIGR01451 family)